MSEDSTRLTEPMWTVQQASKFLNIPVGTMYQWASHGRGPRSYKVGNSRRYDPADLRAWLLSHATESAA